MDLPDLRTLSSVLEGMGALIAPALLISASAMFILSTSNRLVRVIDRVRGLSDRLDALVIDQPPLVLREQRQDMFRILLERLSRRAQLLQLVLLLLYIASGCFVATSAALGIKAFTGLMATWVPPVLALAGTAVFFAACCALVLEAREQHSSLKQEMSFLRELVGHYARAT